MVELDFDNIFRGGFGTQNWVKLGKPLQPLQTPAPLRFGMQLEVQTPLLLIKPISQPQSWEKGKI